MHIQYISLAGCLTLNLPLSLPHLPIHLNPLYSSPFSAALPPVFFFSHVTVLSFTTVCHVKSLPRCGRSLWRRKAKEEEEEEKKWTEEWFVVPGSCSFGKCNGRWLFQVSPICQKCSLQMDTCNSSPPGRGAAGCQRWRQHLGIWKRTFVLYTVAILRVCACASTVLIMVSMPQWVLSENRNNKCLSHVTLLYRSDQVAALQHHCHLCCSLSQ